MTISRRKFVRAGAMLAGAAAAIRRAACAEHPAPGDLGPAAHVLDGEARGRLVAVARVVAAGMTPRSPATRRASTVSPTSF